MLLLQRWYSLSNEAMEDTIYDSYAMVKLVEVENKAIPVKIETMLLRGVLWDRAILHPYPPVRLTFST